MPVGTSDDLCNKPIGEMTLIARRAGVSLLDFMLYCVGKYLSMEMIADASDLKFYKNRSRIK